MFVDIAVEHKRKLVYAFEYPINTYDHYFYPLTRLILQFHLPTILSGLYHIDSDDIRTRLCNDVVSKYITPNHVLSISDLYGLLDFLYAVTKLPILKELILLKTFPKDIAPQLYMLSVLTPDGMDNAIRWFLEVAIPNKDNARAFVNFVSDVHTSLIDQVEEFLLRCDDILSLFKYCYAVSPDNEKLIQKLKDTDVYSLLVNFSQVYLTSTRPVLFT